MPEGRGGPTGDRPTDRPTGEPTDGGARSQTDMIALHFTFGGERRSPSLALALASSMKEEVVSRTHSRTHSIDRRTNELTPHVARSLARSYVSPIETTTTYLFIIRCVRARACAAFVMRAFVQRRRPTDRPRPRRARSARLARVFATSSQMFTSSPPSASRAAHFGGGLATNSPRRPRRPPLPPPPPPP